MKIVDAQEGKWHVLRALYPFPHALRPGVVFIPGDPMKIVSDDWIKSQELIVECPDPTTGAEIPGLIETATLLKDHATGEPVNMDADRAKTKADRAAKK